MSIKIPESQRALIFQGGGALGASEVGFYQAVYEKFIQEKKHKNPYDIIMGTSIGAIGFLKEKTKPPLRGLPLAFNAGFLCTSILMGLIHVITQIVTT